MEKKVVSLENFRKDKTVEQDLDDEQDETFCFEEIMRRNLENKQRLSKERNKANSSVIRSYRLKQ